MEGEKAAHLFANLAALRIWLILIATYPFIKDLLAIFFIYLISSWQWPIFKIATPALTLFNTGIHLPVPTELSLGIQIQGTFLVAQVPKRQSDLTTHLILGPFEERAKCRKKGLESSNVVVYSDSYVALKFDLHIQRIYQSFRYTMTTPSPLQSQIIGQGLLSKTTGWYKKVCCIN
jgi:hypothetical protein